MHKCSCGLCHDARSAFRDEKTAPGLSTFTSLQISVSQTRCSKESGLRPVRVHSCHALNVQTGRTLAQDVEKSCSYDLRMMRQFCERPGEPAQWAHLVPGRRKVFAIAEQLAQTSIAVVASRLQHCIVDRHK